MKTHTIIGAETLDAALRRFPNARFLQFARDIAATHHENFDGSGYPNGLAGEQIPLCGRIVAVADVYDALSSRRVYKSPMGHEQAKAIIIEQKGTHFDPEVVAAFLRAEKQVVEVRESMQDVAETIAAHITLPSMPPRVQNGPSACSILVAEDDPLILDQLVELLTVTGERVFAATDGEEAYRIMEQHCPRVIVSDWVMPKMDGVELCRRIRLRDEPCPAYFIMLTAHAEKSRLLDAYGAGVDDFVSKPFEPEVFLARVRAGIRAAKLHDELIRKANGSQALNAQLAAVNSRLERQAITDELTGLFNRRHGMSRLSEQWAMVERYTRPLTIAMLDVDHFKQINDTMGHDAGDAILKQLAAILREFTRATDTICRVGGDEFLIVFPSQTIEEAYVCAQRCLTEVQAKGFSGGTHPIKATISIGLATRTRAMLQLSDLVKAADEALYAAKNAGRHIVCIAEPGDKATPPGDSPQLPKSGTAAPSTSSQAPIDLAAVLKRCGGDPKFAAAVTERFRTQAGAEVTKIEQALASANPEFLSRTAHTLKSMAAYMAAERAVELARQIEHLGREKQLETVAPLLAALRAEIDRATTWITQNRTETAARCA
jgi:diguanylate cyclase (GGDEF)-like protein